MRIHASYIYFISTIMLLYQNLSSQQKEFILSGIVRDSESKETLPSANIRIVQSTKGTSTNTEGFYRLLLPAGKYQIAISYIGYKSDTLTVIIDSNDFNLNVYLQPTAIPVPDVIILGEQKDPGERVMLEVIAKKQKILPQLQSYRFNAYTKTTFRIEKKTEKMLDTMIAGLLETQTEGFWKTPDYYKELIKARRQTANFSPEQNIFSASLIPKLNDDNIIIQQQSVVGPTAPNALDYYKFEMLDTSVIDNTYIYHIRIKPKNKNQPLFDGVISILDKSFQVVSIDVKGTELLNIRPLTNIRIWQKFAIFENKFCLPVESKTTYLVQLSLPSIPPVTWEQYSLIYDYEINNELSASLFDRYTLSALPTADRTDSSYWYSVNILPLTTEEVKAYERIDSIMTHTDTFTRTIIWLTRFPMKLKDLPFTSLSDFFHFNRVEGAYIGIGLKFSPITNSNTITLRIGYGLSDNRVKYSFGIQQALMPDNVLSVGTQVYRILSYRENTDFVSPLHITWFSLIYKNDPVDYFENRGWSFNVQTKPVNNTLLNMQYHNEKHLSVLKNSDFSIFYPSSKFRYNPPVKEGKLRSLELNFSYDNRKYIDFGISEIQDKSQNSLFMEFSVEHTDRGWLNSDFQFTRCEYNSHLHLLTFASGSLEAYLRLGYTTGELPPQRLFDILGNISETSRDGYLRTVNIKEFAGDRMISLFIEHNFGNFPFRLTHLPIIQSIDFIITGGLAWTGLSDKSRVLQPLILNTNKNILCEVGFGLGKLLTFFRADFTWRLTERTGKIFTFTLASFLI